MSLRKTVALLLCILLSGLVLGQSRKHNASTPGDFSFYMLVLSYAPDFCDQAGGNKDPRECGAGRHVGFVVHGMWPENDTSRGPENCGPASPVSQAIIQLTLNYIPTPSLIQHEWATHGTCSGMAAADYFAALRKARDSVNITADLNQPSQKIQLSPAQIESKLAAANPSFPRAAFRSSCYKNGELQEVRICMDKNLGPRACGSSAGECTAPAVTLLPVR